MALTDFGDLVRGKITNDEYQAIQRKELQTDNKRREAAIIGEFGSWDNYLHYRAIQMLPKG